MHSISIMKKAMDTVLYSVTEIEASILLTGLSNLLRSITFTYHDRHDDAHDQIDDDQVNNDKMYIV